MPNRSNQLSITTPQAITPAARNGTHLARVPRAKTPSVPPVVFEIEPGFVLGARVARSGRKVNHICLGKLEPGMLAPSAARPNVEKPDELGKVLNAAAEAIGGAKGAVGLLVPDSIVRISILDLESFPSDAKEQETLIRWKMKPLLPFPPEEARLSFEVSSRQADHVEVLVAAIRNSVLGGYESLIENLSGNVRLVLPATAALLPLLNNGTGGGELLLHATPASLTSAVVEGRRLRLWRTQQIRWNSPEEWLATASEEAARTLASAEDHLRVRVNRVLLCARPAASEELVAELAREISQPVETLAAGPEYAGQLSMQEAELFASFGAPAAGLLANAL